MCVSLNVVKMDSDDDIVLSQNSKLDYNLSQSSAYGKDVVDQDSDSEMVGSVVSLEVNSQPNVYGDS